MDLAVMCQDFNLCATAASRDPYYWTIRHLHYNHAGLGLFHAHVAGAGHTEVRGCMYSYSRKEPVRPDRRLYYHVVDIITSTW